MFENLISASNHLLLWMFAIKTMTNALECQLNLSLVLIYTVLCKYASGWNLNSLKKSRYPWFFEFI